MCRNKSALPDNQNHPVLPIFMHVFLEKKALFLGCIFNFNFRVLVRIALVVQTCFQGFPGFFSYLYRQLSSIRKITKSFRHEYGCPPKEFRKKLLLIYKKQCWWRENGRTATAVVRAAAAAGRRPRRETFQYQTGNLNLYKITQRRIRKCFAVITVKGRFPSGSPCKGICRL